MHDQSPFDALARLGPGSDNLTNAMLEHCRPITEETLVADIGCGRGASALLLARAMPRLVVALDTSMQSLTHLSSQPGSHNNRIGPVCASMAQMPFAPGTFDLVWAESSIYHLGFATGIAAFADLVCGGGNVVVSELEWTGVPRRETLDFWADAYPQMSTRTCNERAIFNAGLTVVARIEFDEAAWWDEYYGPISQWLESAPFALAQSYSLLAHEIELRRRDASSYNYVAYCCAKS